MAVSLRRVRAEDVKALNLSPVDEKTLAQSAAILREVREGGESALLAIAHKFGDMKPGLLDTPARTAHSPAYAPSH